MPTNAELQNRIKELKRQLQVLEGTIAFLQSQKDKPGAPSVTILEGLSVASAVFTVLAMMFAQLTFVYLASIVAVVVVGYAISKRNGWDLPIKMVAILVTALIFFGLCAAKLFDANRLAEAMLPNFSNSTIDSAVVGASATDPEAVEAWYGVTLDNTGADSSLKNWSVSVLVDGTNLKGDPQFILANQPLHMANGSLMHFSPDADIQVSTLKHPIAHGQIVRGYVAAVFKGVTQDDLLQPGSNVSMQFQDATNKEWSISRTWTKDEPTQQGIDHIMPGSGMLVPQNGSH
jgi:hypothetical protein